MAFCSPAGYFPFFFARLLLIYSALLDLISLTGISPLIPFDSFVGTHSQEKIPQNENAVHRSSLGTHLPYLG